MIKMQFDHRYKSNIPRLSMLHYITYILRVVHLLTLTVFKVMLNWKLTTKLSTSPLFQKMIQIFLFKRLNTFVLQWFLDSKPKMQALQDHCFDKIRWVWYLNNRQLRWCKRQRAAVNLALVIISTLGSFLCWWPDLWIIDYDSWFKNGVQFEPKSVAIIRNLAMTYLR